MGSVILSDMAVMVVHPYSISRLSLSSASKVSFNFNHTIILHGMHRLWALSVIPHDINGRLGRTIIERFGKPGGSSLQRTDIKKWK